MTLYKLMLNLSKEVIGQFYIGEATTVSNKYFHSAVQHRSAQCGRGTGFQSKFVRCAEQCSTIQCIVVQC